MFIMQDASPKIKKVPHVRRIKHDNLFAVSIRAC